MEAIEVDFRYLPLLVSTFRRFFKPNSLFQLSWLPSKLYATPALAFPVLGLQARSIICVLETQILRLVWRALPTEPPPLPSPNASNCIGLREGLWLPHFYPSLPVFLGSICPGQRHILVTSSNSFPFSMLLLLVCVCGDPMKVSHSFAPTYTMNLAAFPCKRSLSSL